MRLFVWELRKLWSSGAARAGVVIVGVVLALALILTALHEPPPLNVPEGVVGRAAAMAGHDTHNAWLFARNLLATVVSLTARGGAHLPALTDAFRPHRR